MDQSKQDQGCINCWSGPRCCSTSLMYSFAQRPDCSVLDEPLYAHYLRLTGLPRPYRQQVLDAQENNGNAVVAQLLAPRSSPLQYVKHMAKHKVGLENTLFHHGVHILLVREPYGVLQSFSKVLQPTQQELGYAAMLEIMSELRALGQEPIIVLSDELVRHPEAVLRALCAALRIDFCPAMLSWPAGPKPYDGLWAPWWYGGTHASAGFSESVREERQPMPPALRPLLGECQVLFSLLSHYALKPLSAHALAPQRALAPQLLPSQSSQSPPQENGHVGDGGGADAVRGLIPRPAVAEVDGESMVHSPEASTAARMGSQAAAGTSGSRSVHAAGAAVSQKVGTHVYTQDDRNADILIGMRDGVNGHFDLVWRPQAKVSVLDSAFMLGDGVWEGIRVHRGVLLLGAVHLDRLWEGAAALDMDLGLSKEALAKLVYDTLDANGMGKDSGIHIRLMVSRGLKPTPYQNPNTTIGKPTIVIIPEYKESDSAPKEQGIRLFTTHVRRGAPDVQDPGWNSHSKLNCIAACIQANKAGANEALMLDPHGFVATCNSTNFFIVKRGQVWAPSSKYQLRGLTRQAVLSLVQSGRVEGCSTALEKDFTLTQVYSADEAFVTGTFAGVIPVVQVDGRTIGAGARGPITSAIQKAYMAFVEEFCAHGRQADARPSCPEADATSALSLVVYR